MTQFKTITIACSFAVLFASTESQADSLEDWMTLEQTRINRSVDETRIHAPDIKGQKAQYRPESGKWFPLKAVWISESELETAINVGSLDPEIGNLLIKKEGGRTFYRLLIHPESEQFYEKLTRGRAVDETTFRAKSTASSRTVVVEALHGPKFFAKLSLDVELAGVRRTIARNEVVSSVGTDIYLDSLKGKIGTENFVHLPEPLGISPRGWEKGGMIIRQIPADIRNNKKKYVPLFSLYSVDESGRSLLQDLAAKANMSPQDFVREKILRPFYTGWVKWGAHGSVTMEAHAQNVLLEIDNEGLTTGRFIHRDLGGFNIDLREASAEVRASLPTFTNVEADYHQHFIDNARRSSIWTYFEGGFVHNLDKELARTEPRYKKGAVLKESWKIFSDAFRNETGVMIGANSLSTPEGVRRGLEKATAAVAVTRTRLSPKCIQPFAELAY